MCHVVTCLKLWMETNLKGWEGAQVAFASRAPGTFFSPFFLDYTNVYLEAIVCMHGHHHCNTQPQWRWGTGLKMHLHLEFPFFILLFILGVVLTYRYSHHDLNHWQCWPHPSIGIFKQIHWQHPMHTTYIDYKVHRKGSNDSEMSFGSLPPSTWHWTMTKPNVTKTRITTMPGTDIGAKRCIHICCSSSK